MPSRHDTMTAALIRLLMLCFILFPVWLMIAGIVEA
jgi:hypothetical protein